MTFKVKDGISIAGSGFVDGSRNVTAGTISGSTATLTGELRGPATFVIDPAAVGDNTGVVVIKGDLQVDGVTTTVNSTTLTVDDKNIELGSVASPTDTTADGGGITLRGTTNKTFTWVDATDAWTSSEHIAIAAGKDLIINGQSSGVINLKAPVLAGTQAIYLPPASGTIALTSDIKDPTITITSGTGLTGSGSFTLNQSSTTTITLSHADTSSAANLTATSRTYVTGLTFDTYGHVTGYTTGTETVTDTNTVTRLRGTASGSYTSGDLTLLAGTGIGVSQSTANFTISNTGVTSITATSPIAASASTGAVTLSHANSGVTAGTYNNVTVNAFGHVTSGSNASYLTAEADTLATVTARGATATASLTIGTGGAYVAGSIYSDASWGMIFRAKQASPTQAQYRWADSADTELMRLVTGGTLTIPGTLYAASKSFLIPHPTQEGKKLRYGSLEGPENGVYIRGKLKGGKVIELPEYWTKLVDPDSITVQLTPIGKHQKLYVEEVKDNKVYIANDGLFAGEINCYYYVLAERVDVEKLEVEIKG
jgi:hypothetical protein